MGKDDTMEAEKGVYEIPSRGVGESTGYTLQFEGEEQLKRGLKSRHIQFLALGGA